MTFNSAPVTTDLMVDLSGKATGTSSPNGSGYYQFNTLANGSYTVTPALTHPKPVPQATPPSATIVINGKSVTQNFTYTTNATCFTGGCH